MVSPEHPSDGTHLAQRFMHAARSFSRHRPCTADAMLQFGDTQLLIRIRDGQVTDIIEKLPPLSSWDFAIRAATPVWERFWETIPAAGSHDIFALFKQGEMTIEGKLHPFMSNLQFMKDLLATGREARV